MPRVVHFEFSADDPERAVKFYKEVFGWRIDKWEGPVDYWLATTGAEDEPGIDGAIKGREEEPKLNTTLNTIDVPSLDEYVERLKAAGGKVLTPRATIPGVGYHCYCEDTEGNVIGLMENDPQAA